MRGVDGRVYKMWGVDGRVYKCGVWMIGFINAGGGWEGL